MNPDILAFGTFFDGDSAEGRVVQIGRSEKTVILLDPESDDKIFEVPFAQVQIERAQRKVVLIHDRRVPGRHIAVDDEEFDYSFKKTFKVNDRGIGVKHGFNVFTVGHLIGIALCLFAAVKGSDLLAKTVSKKIPISWEAAFSGGLEPFIEDRICKDVAAEAALSKVLARILPPSDLTSKKYRIWILDSNMVNAFAMPGGRIVLMDGLIRRSQLAEEMIAVLAHEIQHVNQRHITKQLVRSTLMTSVWGMAFSDYSGILVIDPRTVAQMVTLSFSQEDEAEADAEAIKMLNASNVSAVGLKIFFSRLSEGRNEPESIFNTHPTTKSRMRKVEELNRVKETIVPVISDSEWSSIRMACRNTKVLRKKPKYEFLF